MINNFNSFMNSFNQMMQNPQQYMMQRFGIPKDIAGDPDKIIEKMMNEGRISQYQYNEARNMAQQIQQNPMFRQLVK